MDKKAKDIINYLRSPAAIRQCCKQIFNLGCEDKLRYFRCNLNQLDAVAEYVIGVIKQDYPDLNIPFHSRWRHFECGGVRRVAQLEEKLRHLAIVEKAKIKFDLAIVSVLLDAGAGGEWKYYEKETNQTFQRSEGLAIASFRMFCNGKFSRNPQQPLQADAFGLENLSESSLAEGFQVNENNPIVGLNGRLQLLQRLGKILQNYPEFFGAEKPRLGNLVTYLVNQAQNGTLQASMVLQTILESLGEIWPGRYTINGVNLGDVWPHYALQGNDLGAEYVPFHKLSQWLTYSLLEPLEELGLKITGLDELTGLPEYRNGGLCLDLGILEIKDEGILQKSHLPNSEIIIEWRALTVILLDRLADTIRQKLGKSAADLPLVKVLQGGTWTAGRKIAAELRKGGVSPITIESDGTVF
ncbi:URC4/urg3 family protein [Ancylothrix sp. C2]|uniref:URC4/urg3 family protein n=1 Tax=Ancylothrix sp. D3o TaxID=2953691 RepID=UPI0021BA600F|nr:URC4/urg3 family protein [Ancylothrix sp. D3o]MCT7950618.1 URC4/urg3 family protein [Ancylothrix sp. D3o]